MPLVGRLGWLVGRSVGWEKVVGQLPCYLSPLRAACIQLHLEYKYKYHSEYKYKYDPGYKYYSKYKLKYNSEHEYKYDSEYK